MKTCITKWTETIMRDSFGDLSDAEFDRTCAAYMGAVRVVAPEAELDIEIEPDLVGCGVGVNEIEWSDGSVESINGYNEKPFEMAMDKI